MSDESLYLRVRINAAAKKAIDRAAKKRRVNASVIVRDALADYFADPAIAEMREVGRPGDPAKTKAG